jgi:NADH-quinone oxidoreductase subunit L
MRAPMAILAGASIWLVASVNPFDFSGWVYNGLLPGKQFHFTAIGIISATWVLLALFAAYIARNRSINAPLMQNGFHLNDIYKRLIEMPAFKAADVTAQTDRKWIDGILHLSAYVQLLVAHITGWIDRAVVDGFVDDAAGMAKGIGSFIRTFQSGKIQLYVFWASFAIIIFIIWTLL